jgi:proteic killer suppression protein
MIRGFRSTDAERVFNLQPTPRLPGQIQQVALRKLRMLHRATTLADLRIPPADRLERLSGDRAGQWSIRINDQWRICFHWQDGDAFEVETVDYH